MKKVEFTLVFGSRDESKKNTTISIKADVSLSVAEKIEEVFNSQNYYYYIKDLKIEDK